MILQSVWSWTRLDAEEDPDTWPPCQHLTNHPGAQQFFSIIPRGELAGGDAFLRIVENDVKALGSLVQCAYIERLTIADARAEFLGFAIAEFQIASDPVLIRRRDEQSTPVKAGMILAHSGEYYVLSRVCADHKKWFDMSTEI